MLLTWSTGVREPSLASKLVLGELLLKLGHHPGEVVADEARAADDQGDRR